MDFMDYNLGPHVHVGRLRTLTISMDRHLIVLGHYRLTALPLPSLKSVLRSLYPVPSTSGPLNREVRSMDDSSDLSLRSGRPQLGHRLSLRPLKLQRISCYLRSSFSELLTLRLFRTVGSNSGQSFGSSLNYSCSSRFYPILSLVRFRFLSQSI
jgi:hypothetical protein